MISVHRHSKDEFTMFECIFSLMFTAQGIKLYHLICFIYLSLLF